MKRNANSMKYDGGEMGHIVSRMLLCFVQDEG
jgi:hypothetical protein